MGRSNKAQRVSKRPAGLIGLLAAGLVGLMPMGDAKAGIVYMDYEFSGVNTSTSDVMIGSLEGATNGYDPGLDTTYSEPSGTAVGSYSQTISGNLQEDFRDPLMYPQEFNIITQTYDTTNPVTGTVEFNVLDNTYYEGQPITADIYINDTLVYNDINVWEADTNNTQYSLTINPGDSVRTNISVVPEPAAIVGLVSMALAGLGIYGYRKRKNKNPTKKERIDSYFED